MPSPPLATQQWFALWWLCIHVVLNVMCDAFDRGLGGEHVTRLPCNRKLCLGALIQGHMGRI